MLLVALVLFSVAFSSASFAKADCFHYGQAIQDHEDNIGTGWDDVTKEIERHLGTGYKMVGFSFSSSKDDLNDGVVAMVFCKKRIRRVNKNITP